MKYLVDCSPSSFHLILDRIAMASERAFSISASLLVIAAILVRLGLPVFCNLFSLLVRFRMPSVLLPFASLPAFWQ